MKLIAPLDAVRDLPKVRANLDTLLVTIHDQGCRYGSPCAIGAMIDDPTLRARLDQSADEEKRTGNRLCILRLRTAEQMNDLLCLQHDFDSGHVDTFFSTLQELEEKYLSPPPAENDRI